MKLKRGTFTAIFFLACIAALELEQVVLEEILRRFFALIALAIKTNPAGPMMVVAAMSEIANHVGKEPWPSLESLSWWFDKASMVLAGSLFIGFVCTVIIIWLGIVKEHHWDLARERANERLAGVNKETARLTADNLALQTVMLPRNVGAIGIDQRPPAETWFAGFERWAGVKILIQVTPGDPEALNLANEIAIVLAAKGWLPEMVDEKRTRISLRMSEGLNVFAPSSHKAWDPQNETQKIFSKLSEAAILLARALTNAGLGVGPYPVGGSNGYGIVVDWPPDSPAARTQQGDFSPSLDGVYLQVGARPISRTLQWIKQGRPDEFGIKPADRVPAENPK